MIIGEGGYYEGQFERGEIQGHGYRVFGLSGSTYSGQFQQGEMHGQGLLRKTSGEQYEGSWVFGKKQGSSCVVCYQGYFKDFGSGGRMLQCTPN